MAQSRSYRGLLLIVTMWVLAIAIAALAATNLFGLARMIGYAMAMAIGMFANDAIDLDAMFPGMKRAWIATGFIRAVTGLWGIIAVLFVAVVRTNDWRSSLLTAMVIGFVVGALAGTLVRTVREWRTRKERKAT